MQRKDKPLFALDTHAGRGLYALDSEQAQKTGEAATGIQRLRSIPDLELPKLYADALASYGHLYPGSCALIAQALRPGDRATFCERHPQEFAALRDSLGFLPSLQLKNSDGFAAIKSELPPVQKRGLIHIDPSYETAGDYRNIVKSCQTIRHRFRAGVILIWYPLLGSGQNAGAAQKMLEHLSHTAEADDFCVELRVRETTASGLYGSGMAVLNPPYRLAETIAATMKAISPHLAVDTEANWDIRPL